MISYSATLNGFDYHDSALACDGVPLAAIARAEGTPLYVYSAATIAARYRALDEAFGAHPHALHYALKANSTLAVLRLLRALGAGADANSGGEIEVALRAGFIPPQIVFTGVGKRHDELELAVELGVNAINVESAGELDRLDAIASARGLRARVAIRVNPDIDARSHPHISTGLRSSKFGVPLAHVASLCRERARRQGLALIGLHVHVGSQITSMEPIARALAAIVSLARELRAEGLPIEHVDAGGGLGIAYDAGVVPPTSEEYAAALLPIVRGSGLTLLIEPGRTIVGPAGALVSRVVDVKGCPGGRTFVVLDAGMTELLRPALYGAHHRIVPVDRRDDPAAPCDIVGPICESSDTFGVDRPIVVPKVDDLVAILDAGAYGSVMGSTYNRRPLPSEVLVEAGSWRVVRRRQTIDDMLALEI
jgi:diaminopimelate decarboxylase